MTISPCLVSMGRVIENTLFRSFQIHREIRCGEILQLRRVDLAGRFSMCVCAHATRKLWSLRLGLVLISCDTKTAHVSNLQLFPFFCPSVHVWNIGYLFNLFNSFIITPSPIILSRFPSLSHAGDIGMASISLQISSHLL
jgi:hypothetical protein